LTAVELVEMEPPSDWCCGVRHDEHSPRDFPKWNKKVLESQTNNTTFQTQEKFRHALVESEYFQVREMKALEPYWKSGLWICAAFQMNHEEMKLDPASYARYRGYLTHLFRLLVAPEPMDFYKVDDLRYYVYLPYNENLWDLMDLCGRIARVAFKFRGFVKQVEPTFEEGREAKLALMASVGVHEGEAVYVKGEAFGTAVERSERMALAFTRKSLMEFNRHYVIFDEWIFNKLLQDDGKAEEMLLQCNPIPSEVYMLDKCARTTITKIKGIACSMRFVEETHRAKLSIKMAWPDLSRIPTKSKPAGFECQRGKGLIIATDVSPCDYDRLLNIRPTYFRNITNIRHLIWPLALKDGGQLAHAQGTGVVVVFDDEKLKGKAIEHGFSCVSALMGLISGYNHDRTKANMLRLSVCLGYGDFCIHEDDVVGEEVLCCTKSAKEVAGCGQLLETPSLLEMRKKKDVQQPDWLSPLALNKGVPRCSGSVCHHADEKPETSPPEDVETSMETGDRGLIFIDRHFPPPEVQAPAKSDVSTKEDSEKDKDKDEDKKNGDEHDEGAEAEHEDAEEEDEHHGEGEWHGEGEYYEEEEYWGEEHQHENLQMPA